MARAPAAGLPAPASAPAGGHSGLGVIAGALPLDRVRQILADTGKAGERGRDLPAQVMVC